MSRPRTIPDSPRLPRGAARALIASIVLTFVLYAMPYGRVIGRPLVWLSTLAHEVGHGLTAWLVGGSFERFVMYADGSGAASWSGQVGRIGRALVAAGGLVGPSIAAAMCFRAGRSGVGARRTFSVAAVVLLLLLVLVVRNPFGVLFVLGCALGSAWIAAYAEDWFAQIALVFVAVQLSLSVFSRSDYLFVETARTGAGTMPSDVAHMAQALFLPYWFWGLVCGAVSLAVLGIGVWGFLAPASRRSQR